METCATDSSYMNALHKGLIAQIEIVRNHDGHDAIVEYWETYADKDADFNKELK